MGVNNRKKGMHIVRVCPDHHFADSRGGKVEHALTAQVFDRIRIYMSGLRFGDEEVPTLLLWLWLAYFDYQTDATGVT